MRKIIVLIVMLAASVSFGQAVRYDLKGLSSVKLQYSDHAAALDSAAWNKFLAECSVKLAGVSLPVSEYRPNAALVFKIDKIQAGILTDPRLVFRVEVIEKVKPYRKTDRNIEALTYQNIKILPVASNNLSAGSVAALNDMFLAFLSSWIEANKKSR